MDIETLVDSIVCAFEDEPDGDYGSRETDKWVRDRAVRARIYDLLLDYTDSVIAQYLPEEDA